MVNLDLYQAIEPFWRGKMYWQFVIVVLVRASMNMIFKILWKLIVDKKKEHLNSQLNTLIAFETTTYIVFFLCLLLFFFGANSET